MSPPSNAPATALHAVDPRIDTLVAKQEVTRADVERLFDRIAAVHSEVALARQEIATLAGMVADVAAGVDAIFRKLP